MGLDGYITLAAFGVILLGTLVYGTWWDRKQAKEQEEKEDK